MASNYLDLALFPTRARSRPKASDLDFSNLKMAWGVSARLHTPHGHGDAPVGRPQQGRLAVHLRRGAGVLRWRPCSACASSSRCSSWPRRCRRSVPTFVAPHASSSTTTPSPPSPIRATPPSVKPSKVGYAFDMYDNLFGEPGDKAENVRAKNLNSVDEVPDSSWFTNRIGSRPMTVDELVRANDTAGARTRDVDGRVGQERRADARVRDRGLHARSAGSSSSTRRSTAAWRPARKCSWTS